MPSGSGNAANSSTVDPGGGFIIAESISISQISLGNFLNFFCVVNSDVIPIINGVGASKSYNPKFVKIEYIRNSIKIAFKLS